ARADAIAPRMNDPRPDRAPANDHEVTAIAHKVRSTHSPAGQREVCPELVEGGGSDRSCDEGPSWRDGPRLPPLRPALAPPLCGRGAGITMLMAAAARAWPHPTRPIRPRTPIHRWA